MGVFGDGTPADAGFTAISGFFGDDMPVMIRQCILHELDVLPVPSFSATTDHAGATTTGGRWFNQKDTLTLEPTRELESERDRNLQRMEERSVLLRARLFCTRSCWL